MVSFADFNISTHAYKTVGEHQILTDVMMPKNMKAGEKPLLIRMHGGFLITGSRCDEKWIAPWLLAYAHSHSFVIVNADYRLMPESNGKEILEDAEDIWKWAHQHLPRFLASTIPGVEVDFNRVLVSGESAGGYLAIQLGLSHAKDGICAIIAAYPILDIKSPFYTTSYTKQMLGTPMFLPSVIDDHLSSIRKSRPIISNATWPERLDLTFASIQQGRFLAFLGPENDSDLFPEDRIRSGATLPALFIFHGKSDSAVPIEGTEKFVALIKDHNAIKEEELYFCTADGDHGFDATAKLEDKWLEKGLAMVNEALTRK